MVVAVTVVKLLTTARQILAVVAVQAELVTAEAVVLAL